MLKLFRKLKPFTLQIVAIFVLLFGQAMSDLSLPSYMSDIVNIGIQQGGIEEALPQAVRAREFNRLTLFMSEADKSRARQNYTLLDKASLAADDFTRYVSDYPVLASEPVYFYSGVSRGQDK